MSDVPTLTVEQMREVDRVMVEDLGVTLLQMMENAGRSLAWLAIEEFHPERVTVLAGSGGNGGGAMAAARHLHNQGVAVAITPTRPDSLSPAAAHQAHTLFTLGVEIANDPVRADLVIDGVIGYSLTGNPRGRAAELIHWANDSGVPVLSLDGPSGLDFDSGRAGDPCVTAASTLTLALPKVGLLGAPEVGDLWIADLSVPPEVYETFGIDASGVFAGGPVRRLTA